MAIRLEYRVFDTDTDGNLVTGALDFHPDGKPQRIYEGSMYLWKRYSNWTPTDIAVFQGFEVVPDFKRAGNWAHVERTGPESDSV